MEKTNADGRFKIAKLYNNTIEVKFDNVSHRYYINGAPAKFTTTGISGILDKPALIPWAIKETLKKVEKMLPVGTTVDENLLAAILALSKAQADKTRDQAADAGTQVHALLEQWVLEGIAQGNGKAMPTPERLARLEEIFKDYPEGLQMSMQQFRAFIEKEKVMFTASEKLLYSKKYGYPGQMDVESFTKGKLTVDDFKVRGGVYDETRLQLALYQIAAEEESGQKYKGRRVFRFGRKDGIFTGDFEVIEYADQRKDAQAALAALKIKKWLVANAKAWAK